MITLREYKYPEAKLYAPDDTFMGLIENDIELNDIRIQIAQAKVEGYYIMFKNKRIIILSNGDCNIWPKGFFDGVMIQLSILFKIKRKEPYKYNIYETT